MDSNYNVLSEPLLLSPALFLFLFRDPKLKHADTNVIAM